MKFDPDFTRGRDGHGREVSFTSSESRALAFLSGRPNRVVTREQILDAVSEPGSDRGDRTVDFLINRLRRKLGDKSTDPRFIATRYGEGYIWIAERVRAPSEADVIVGPLRGLENLGDTATRAREFAEDLRKSISSDLGERRTVVLEPDHDPRADHASDLSVELSFLRHEGRLDCVAATRDGPTARLLHVTRHAVGDTRSLRPLAAALLARSWQSVVVQDTELAPLPVAMHDAAGHPIGTRLSWADNDRRLKALLSDAPDDDAAKLMYAAHLHTKYVQHGWDLFRKGIDDRREDEDTIERLVLDALPFVEARPNYAVMAGKLLYFLQRGYGNLAVDLAESALSSGTAVAASLATVGQMRGFRGDMRGGLDLLGQAATLCDGGSEQHAWVLAQLCQVAVVAGNRARLEEAKAELYAIRPASRVSAGILLTDPKAPSVVARGAVAVMSRARAEAILRNLWYITGRLFEERRHRENLMRAPVVLIRRRFGAGAVPAEVVAGAPGLFAD